MSVVPSDDPLIEATNHKTTEANPRQPPSGRTYQFSSKSVTSSYNFWYKNLFRSKALCNSYPLLVLVRFLLEKATNHKTTEANPWQPPSGRTYQFSSKSVTSSYNFWVQNLFRSKALCNSYHEFNCGPYGPKLWFGFSNVIYGMSIF